MSAVAPELRRVIDALVRRLGRRVRPPRGVPGLRAEIQAAVEEAYRQQFRGTYRYVVGSWSGGVRAKSSRSGKFVRRAEVLRYLLGGARGTR